MHEDLVLNRIASTFLTKSCLLNRTLVHLAFLLQLKVKMSLNNLFIQSIREVIPFLVKSIVGKAKQAETECALILSLKCSKEVYGIRWSGFLPCQFLFLSK